jgi:hypothetical protein
VTSRIVASVSASVALLAVVALVAVAVNGGLSPARATPLAQTPASQMVSATDSDSGAPVLLDMSKVLYVRREPTRTLVTFQSAPPTQIYIREDPADLR